MSNLTCDNSTTLIVKITGKYCNLQCQYCYYAPYDQTIKTVMSTETLESLISQYLNAYDSVDFIWHGGEPLMAGIKTFETIVELEKRYKRSSTKINNRIQTNGTLIDQDWARFFAKNNFHVGVSIDGTKETHDRLRIFPRQEGSYDSAVNGLKILQKEGLNVGVVAVVTKHNACRIEQDLKNFLSIGIKNLGFNVFYEPNPEALLYGFSLTADDYTEFLIKIIDFWLLANDSRFRIREIDELMAILFQVPAKNCRCAGTCTRFITVDWDGSVYACDSFPQSYQESFGNIKSQNLTDILDSFPRKKFIQEIKYEIEQCGNCNLYQYCHNGCSAQRVNGHYYFCQSKRKAYSYLKERVGKVIEELLPTFKQ